MLDTALPITLLRRSRSRSLHLGMRLVIASFKCDHAASPWYAFSWKSGSPLFSRLGVLALALIITRSVRPASPALSSRLQFELLVSRSEKAHLSLLR